VKLNILGPNFNSKTR